jgi:hypothetical protein
MAGPPAWFKGEEFFAEGPILINLREGGLKNFLPHSFKSSIVVHTGSKEKEFHK